MERTRLVYKGHTLTAQGLRLGVTVYHDVEPFPGGLVAPWPFSVALSLDDAERLRQALNASGPMGHGPRSRRVSGTDELRQALNAELPGLLAAREAKGRGQ